MGFAVIGKLTDNLYIIKEGKNSIEAKDYIAYMKSLENANPVKALSFSEIKANVRKGLDKLIKPLLEDLKNKDRKEFSNFIAFLFLLRVKLYVDYIFKKGLDGVPLMEEILIKTKDIDPLEDLNFYINMKTKEIEIFTPNEDVSIDNIIQNMVLDELANDCNDRVCLTEEGYEAAKEIMNDPEFKDEVEATIKVTAQYKDMSEEGLINLILENLKRSNNL